MAEPLYLILPMAGAGTRFLDGGCDCPKPLIPLHGKPFFYWAATSLAGRLPLAGLRFAVLQTHVERFAIDRAILSYFPQAEIISLPEVLPGAVLTCREGVRGLPEDAAVLFNDCDHLFRCRALETLLQSDAPKPDGLLLSFPAAEPRYSFLERDAHGRVIRTAEKEVISNEAICGAYYFRRKADFLRCASRYLTRCRYAEFFMSGVYDELIAEGGNVAALPTDLHISFGTPTEYAEAAADPRFEALP